MSRPVTSEEDKHSESKNQETTDQESSWDEHERRRDAKAGAKATPRQTPSKWDTPRRFDQTPQGTGWGDTP